MLLQSHWSLLHFINKLGLLSRDYSSPGSMRGLDATYGRCCQVGGWMPHPLNEALWCWIWWYVGGMVIFVSQLWHYLLQSWHWLLHYLLYKLWLAAKHWDVGVPMYGSVPMRPSHNLVTSNGQPPPHLLLPSQCPTPTPNFWQLRPRSRSKSVCYSQARVLVNFSCLSLGGMLPIVNGIYSCLHRTWKQCVLCILSVLFDNASPW